jgi:hypothetical protein
MTTITSLDEFRAALDQLETSLSTPIVAGELVDWAKVVQDSWQNASDQICRQLTDVHPRQYQEMADADPEMLACVEKLQAEDREIDEERDSFHRHLARVVEHAPKFERDEEKIRDYTTSLIDAGLALIQRARKQEVALQTWFVEAFNRDRGVAD